MANQNLPVLERHVAAQSGSTPNIQGTVDEFAASQNNLSAIGAKVAQSASNALAQHLGTQAGQNPTGNLGPSLTDFDKGFAESYSTQAHATLGLQANKLITDVNISASSASRVTPQLIANSQKNISEGLKKIYEMAPSNIRPQLEATYNAAQLSQSEQLSKRMLSEQHEDTRQTTILSNDKNAELAHTLAASGKFDAADSLVKTTQAMNSSAVGQNVGFSKEQGKVGTDTVRQSAINGRLQFEYDKAVYEKKGDEYLKSLAKRPDWISDADYPSATQSIRSYVNNQAALKSNYEELIMSDFKAKISQDISSIPGTEVQATLDKLSPVNASKLNAYYQNALRKQANEGESQAALSAAWDNPTAHANAPDKVKNATFNSKVSYAMKNNPNLSSEEAEVQVASTAGGKIPVFEKSLENKLLSARPDAIESGAHQIQLLNNLEAGRAYAGISEKAKAVAVQFQQQRGSMPDSDLARKITDNLSNVDGTMQKTLDNSWNIILSTQGAGGMGASVPLHDFALKQLKLGDSKSNKFGGQYFGVIYGNDLYNQLNSNFITTRGDYNAALQMTKDYYKQHYGETHVNGSTQISDSPIERYLGYEGKPITPYVQQDMLDQLSTSFKKSNESNPSDTWETLPLKSGVAEVMRTVETKDGKKQYRYPVNLVGRAGNQWDVTVKTPYGNRNLFLVAPHAGVTTYQPNKAAIDKNFQSHSINPFKLTNTKDFLNNG